MNKQIHREVLANQVFGILMGWLIVMYLFPLFNHLPQSQVATISTVLFFVASYMRMYVIRLIFSKEMR